MLDILLEFVVKYVIARFQYANRIPQESKQFFSLSNLSNVLKRIIC